MKHAFLENNLLFKSAMHSSLGASIAYSHSKKESVSHTNLPQANALEGSMYVLTEQMRFYPLVLHWEVMAGILIFFGFIFVPGREDLPSDARAYSLTSFEE